MDAEKAEIARSRIREAYYCQYGKKQEMGIKLWRLSRKLL